MQNKPIEMPMYFADGFIDGLEKAFPDGSTSHAEITEIKQQTVNFLRQSGKKIRKIEEARKAIYDDPTQTEQAKAVNIYKQAEKRINEIQDRAENLPPIGEFIQYLESDIDQAIEEKASTDFARETRQRVVSMDKKERGKFVSTALRNEDYKIASYVLGAPSFLSGIPDKTHKELKSQYKKSVFGEEMQAIEALDSLHVHLEKGLKATNKIKRNVRARASLNDAIGKSDKAQSLMS